MQAVAHTDAHIRVRRSGVVSRELGGGGGGGGVSFRGQNRDDVLGCASSQPCAR